MEQAENYAVASRLVAAKTAAAQNADEDGEEEIAPVATKGTTITRPSELLDAVLQSGRKGLSIQRYKGLGEMNAEQLWETTLDPGNRSLMRVEINQAEIGRASCRESVCQYV